MKKQNPSIKLSEAVKSELDRMKIADGETYEGVIKRIVKIISEKSKEDAKDEIKRTEGKK